MASDGAAGGPPGACWVPTGPQRARGDAVGYVPYVSVHQLCNDTGQSSDPSSLVGHGSLGYSPYGQLVPGPGSKIAHDQFPSTFGSSELDYQDLPTTLNPFRAIEVLVILT